MLRPILITGIAIQTVLIVIVFLIKLLEPVPQPTITQPPPIQEIVEDPEQPKQPLPDLVLEINQRNSKISSFSCEDMIIKTWERGMKFRLNGEIHYEKDRSFRLVLASVFGSELDLGSNDTIFWYWSRRDKHPGLYWSKHEDFYKTRLKTPFNPMFMRDTLGLNVIEEEGAKIGETEKEIIVAYERISSMRDPILYTIVINKALKKISGFIITDPQGNPLAVAEITEYKNDLPSQLLYTWYEEGKTLLLEFRNPQINLHIPSNLWSPPNESPKIDMSKE